MKNQVKFALVLLSCFIIMPLHNDYTVYALENSSTYSTFAEKNYTWNGIEVHDYLGENFECDRLREIIYTYWENKNMEYATSAFIGAFQNIQDSYILMAGIYHEGEWMPDLYQIEHEKIKCIAKGYDIGLINRTLINAKGNNYLVYFGKLFIDKDNLGHAQVCIASKSESIFSTPMSSTNATFVALQESIDPPVSIRCYAYGTNIEIPILLERDVYDYVQSTMIDDSQMSQILSHSIVSVPAYYNGHEQQFPRWDNRVIASSSRYYFRIQEYASNFDDGRISKYMVEPLPMELYLAEQRRGDSHIYAKDKILKLFLDNGDILDMPEISIETIQGDTIVNFNVEEMALLVPEDFAIPLIIKVHADYDRCGSISWIIRIDKVNT